MFWHFLISYNIKIFSFLIKLSLKYNPCFPMFHHNSQKLIIAFFSFNFMRSNFLLLTAKCLTNSFNKIFKEHREMSPVPAHCVPPDLDHKANQLQPDFNRPIGGRLRSSRPIRARDPAADEVCVNVILSPTNFSGPSPTTQPTTGAMEPQLEE